VRPDATGVCDPGVRKYVVNEPALTGELTMNAVRSASAARRRTGERRPSRRRANGMVKLH
jgi:hypothetical protein